MNIDLIGKVIFIVIIPITVILYVISFFGQPNHFLIILIIFEFLILIILFMIQKKKVIK